MLGIDYILEHCVAFYKAEHKEELFRVYITDCLAAIIKGKGGTVKRYYDIVHPQKQDTRSAREIADDIVARAGLKEVSLRGRIKAEGNARAG